METTINITANEVKKDLYKSKANAKFSHYCHGNLYYDIEVLGSKFQFPIKTIESIDGNDSLSSDLGTTSFLSEIKGSDLNRWIAKAIENKEFVKIS